MPKAQTGRVACINAARGAARRWRTYVVLAAVAVAVIAVLPTLALRQGYTGLILGVLAMLVVISLVAQGNPATDPAVAERWSRAPLRKVRGWSVTDNLPFERDDVDHVVVTPAAVLAVETRYHATPATADRLRRDLASAERAAHKVRLFLRAEHLRDVAVVVPVLIVWGPGAPDLAEGQRSYDAVHLVDGSHPERWMGLFSAAKLSTATRRDLHGRFQRFAADRAGYDARVLPSLRAEVWRELRSGIADERAQRTSRRRPVGVRAVTLSPVPAPASVGVPSTAAVAAGTTQTKRPAR
jgi:hypothetical protein